MREWLKTIRTDMGLTMKEMGEKLGISESYYCSIEAGDRQKKMDVMLCHSIATIAGMGMAEVFEMERCWRSGSTAH